MQGQKRVDLGRGKLVQKEKNAKKIKGKGKKM